MAKIKINGLVIETDKHYREYTPQELKVLPPLNVKSKSHVRLGVDGKWYLDTDEWY